MGGTGLVSVMAASEPAVKEGSACDRYMLASSEPSVVIPALVLLACVPMVVVEVATNETAATRRGARPLRRGRMLGHDAGGQRPRAQLHL